MFAAWVELAVLAVVGLFAGYINAIAGAGSLLTLPALIFTGLDAGAANATNRVAVVFQNAAAIYAFRGSGIQVFPIASRVIAPMAAAAAAGAWVASTIDDDMLSRLIVVAMGVFLALTFVRVPSVPDDLLERETPLSGGERRPSPSEEGPRSLPPFRPTMLVGFVAIGFYAGLLQAGVGILFLLYLGLAHRADLVAANALKVMAILVLALVSLTVFVAQGVHIDLLRGAILAASSSLGGYLGAKAALKRGAGYVRVMMVLAVLGSMAKLLYGFR